MAAKKASSKTQATLREYRHSLEAALNDLPRLAVIAGESEFLRAEAVSLFREEWLRRFPSGDEIVIRGVGESRSAGLADILGELSGGSLFAQEKLVVVRQAEKILFPQSGRAAGGDDGETPAAAAGGREKAFLERIGNPPERIWLLLECPAVPRNRTIGKRLAESAFSVPCPQPFPRDIPGWLDARARGSGKRLDDEAADLLCRAHGTDLGVLSGEIDKLVLFAGDGDLVDAGMVTQFLTGTIEFDIFGFTNAIEARDAGRAVFFARRIAVQGTRDQRGKKEDGERSAHRVLAMLAGTVQSLLRARVADARRLGAADFAAAEKLSPWRAELLLEAASRFSLRELRVMARYAADQLRRAHDTGGDALLSLELMAVKFTGKDLL